MSAHARSRWIRVPILTVVAVSAVAVAPAGASAQKAGARPERGAPASKERAGLRGFLLSKRGFTRFDAADPTVELFPLGLSENGLVTGEYLRRDSESGLLRTRDGRVTSFDVPGAKGTEALKVNNRGEIVVHYSNDTGYVNDSAEPRSGVMYRGRLTPIKYPGAALTLANGINNKGQVVGSYQDGNGGIHPFRWDRGRFTDIDTTRLPDADVIDINERGQILGTYGDPSSGRGFVWDKGRITTFAVPTGPITLAYGINDRGRVVGFTLQSPDLTNPVARGYLLARGANGPATPINFPGAAGSGAMGISNSGMIVGFYFTSLLPIRNANGIRAASSRTPLGPRTLAR